MARPHRAKPTKPAVNQGSRRASEVGHTERFSNWLAGLTQDANTPDVAISQALRELIAAQHPAPGSGAFADDP
jgi:hypothetical protein